MRYLLIMLLLPSLALGQIKIEEDEFTGEVTYMSEETRPIGIEESDAKRAFYQALCIDGQYGINIFTVSDDETFSYDDKRIYFLVDGEKEKYSIADQSSRYDSQMVVSTATVLLEKANFKNIGNADTVRFKVGNNVFSMSKASRYDMREIIKETQLVNRN